MRINRWRKSDKEAGEKLGLRGDLLETDIYRLTDLLDNIANSSYKLGAESHCLRPIHYPLKEGRQLQAFARRPDLLSAINELLGQSGIVGETNNRLFVFIIALSHLTRDTLHVLIQGSSGSGKTRLLQQIAIACQWRVERFTRLSDKVLYNYPENYLRNKLLCLEDVDGLSEEAEFAWRELVSNGELISRRQHQGRGGPHQEREAVCGARWRAWPVRRTGASMKIISAGCCW